MAEVLPYVEEEDAKIVRFVRSPDGKRVVVMREGRKGEGWVVRGKGRLERAGGWTGEADLVVVLNDSQNFFMSFSLQSTCSNFIFSSFWLDR